MEKNFILTVFRLIDFLILARIFISWVPININYKLKQFIYNLTEPLLKPFRNIIPITSFGVDFSPILAFICLEVLQNILLNLFY